MRLCITAQSIGLHPVAFLLLACPDYTVNLTAEDTRKIITSPNYGDFYPRNINCNWLITSPFGETVLVRVLELAIKNTDGLNVS